MVRAPCCEKMGLKKGPWTPEEDQILINYIQLHGHGNWRALPKQAGLLRCGKSCRLRWINYLRPDIKRGNFTREEEDTIINLHEMLGNRWSAIAARLPGRTDNEIKNVWHTHLKKRLKQKQQQEPVINNHSNANHVTARSEICSGASTPDRQDSTTTSSDMSSVTSSAANNACVKTEPSSSENNHDSLVEIDENFWTEVLSAENSGISIEDSNDRFSAVGSADPLSIVEFQSSLDDFRPGSTLCDNTDFWFNLFTKAGDFSEMLPEIL
ncbi:hypothetical protein CUMW_051110 [Citrus unshiu]|nr:hypothetical protein CUMW_051110 [Citrus unshiu]